MYAGNADTYQDLPVLFDAISRIPEVGLLVVTGSSTAGLRQLAATTGIPAERLRLVESTRFRDTLDALCVGVAAGLPRTSCAGFPIKLLNQLALGLPTVAAEGSAADIPGVVVVPNHDPTAMAKAFRKIASNPTLRQQLSVDARQAIRKEWTWDVRACALEEFYERILAN